MPSLQRRRELDLRTERFESEMGVSDFKNYPRLRVYQCSECHTLYQERSRHCPRCDKKRMGELRPMREDEVASSRERSIRKIRDKLRF